MLFLTKPMAVLLAVIPLSGLDCDWFAADKVFVSTDYLSAEAFDITVKNGVLDLKKISVTGKNGKKVEGFTFTTFNDIDGAAGFQDPPDIMTSALSVSSNPPSTKVDMGDVSNNTSGNGAGASWELKITLSPNNGEQSVFSGTAR